MSHVIFGTVYSKIIGKNANNNIHSLTCLGSLGDEITNRIFLVYYHNAQGTKTHTPLVTLNNIFSNANAINCANENKALMRTVKILCQIPAFT